MCGPFLGSWGLLPHRNFLDSCDESSYRVTKVSASGSSSIHRGLRWYGNVCGDWWAFQVAWLHCHRRTYSAVRCRRKGSRGSEKNARARRPSGWPSCSSNCGIGASWDAMWALGRPHLDKDVGGERHVAPIDECNGTRNVQRVHPKVTSRVHAWMPRCRRGSNARRDAYDKPPCEAHFECQGPSPTLAFWLAPEQVRIHENVVSIEQTSRRRLYDRHQQTR